MGKKKLKNPTFGLTTEQFSLKNNSIEPQLKQCILWEGGKKDFIKGLVSSVNHGFQIKMMMVVLWCEKGTGGSFHHQVIMLTQSVTIYHG